MPSRTVLWGLAKMFLVSLVFLGFGVALLIQGEPIFTFTALFAGAVLLICTLVIGTLIFLGFLPPPEWTKLAEDPEPGPQQEMGRDISD